MNWQHRNLKKLRQANIRGWTDSDIQNVLDNPVETRATLDYSTGDTVIVYYRADGHYVVRNDITGDVFQVSNTSDPAWIDPFDEVVRPRL